jgi:hypothetical protein
MPRMSNTVHLDAKWGLDDNEPRCFTLKVNAKPDAATQQTTAQESSE